MPENDSTAHRADPPLPSTSDWEVTESASQGIQCPERVGRFLIRSELDRGSFGTVYLGYDDQLDRPVAIKVPHLPTEEPARGHAVDRFLREARSAANLDHPHIVSIYHVEDMKGSPAYADGTPFIVMQYVAGGTLAKLVGDREISHGTAARIISEIASALSYAHAEGFVHRDLKPHNILVELIDGDIKPYVADFGLAIDEEELLAHGPGGAGTMPYMSPEQIDQRPDIDGRSDIYALGVVLYEILTGQLPFAPGPNLWARILEAEPKPPLQRDRAIPSVLSSICLKCLEKNPGDRYQAADELIEALKPFATRKRPTDFFAPNWGRTGLPPKLLLWHGPFVGRLSQLNTLGASIAQGTVIPVTGPLNAGKTSLLCKFFTDETSTSKLVDRFPPDTPIGLCYIDLSSFEYHQSPVLRGLSVALSAKVDSVEQLADPVNSDRQLRAYLLENLIPSSFQGISPILVFDQADQVLESRSMRDELDKLLGRNELRVGAAVVATTSQDIPDGNGKRLLETPITIPEQELAPNESRDVQRYISEATGESEMSANAVQRLVDDGMFAAFKPRDVVKAITILQENEQAGAPPIDAEQILSALYQANAEVAVEPVLEQLSDLDPTPQAMDGNKLSSLGWFLALSILGDCRFSQEVVERHVSATIVGAAIGRGLFTDLDGLLQLDSHYRRALRIHLSQVVFTSTDGEHDGDFAAAVGEVLNSTLLSVRDGDHALGTVDEAYSWVKRNLPHAVALQSTLAGFLMKDGIDDVIFPVARDDAIALVERAEEKADTAEEMLSQRLVALAAGVRFEADGNELYASLVAAIDAVERVDELQGRIWGEDLRIVDLAAVVAARRCRRFADVLSQRERIGGVIRQQIHDHADNDLRLAKWGVSWFLNSAFLAVSIGHMSQAQEYLHFAREEMAFLPTPKKDYARADAAWFEARITTLEARIEPSSRVIKLQDAVTATRKALSVHGNANPQWCHRHMSAVRRLLAELPNAAERQHAIDDAISEIMSACELADATELTLPVRVDVARLIRHGARFLAGPEDRLAMANDATAILATAEADLRSSADSGDTEGLLELARLWAFIAGCHKQLENDEVAKEYLVKGRQLAGVALKCSASAAAWYLYLRLLDWETTGLEWDSHVAYRDIPSAQISAELREAMKNHRQWQKKSGQFAALNGKVALWCRERKWQEEGFFHDIANQKYGKKWCELSPRTRRKEIEQRYKDRNKPFGWLKRNFEPFPELYRALAWHETQYRRLVGVPQNGGNGKCDPEPVLKIFREAKKYLPDNWRIISEEARLYRYIWDFPPSIALFREAILMVSRIEEQRRLKTELAEVLLTASIFALENQSRFDRVNSLQEAFGYIQDVEPFQRHSRSVAVLRDRIAFELGENLDWKQLDETYNLVFRDDDYVNSIIVHSPELRRAEPKLTNDLGDAVQQHFTDVDVLRSFGSLFLRRAETLDDSVEAIERAKQAYAAFNACRILEVRRLYHDVLYDEREISTTRFERARAILVAAERSQDVNPLGVDIEGKRSELTYAGGLFHSVADRSVGAFHNAAERFMKKAQTMHNDHREK